MNIAQYIRVLEKEGQLLASNAELAGPDATVSTCPGWQVRDLLRHTGMVHRWATAFVVEGHRSYHPDGGEPALDGAELLDWFRAGHARLVAGLEGAPADLECWTFLPAPSPLAFWARRQAHETTVHRVDSESALRGTDRDTIDAAFAVDGIEELLVGMHAREKSRVRSAKPGVLRVRATDTDAVWTVRISDAPPSAERGDAGEADCELSGPAARLYLALWNRLPAPRLTGDPELARLWRENSAVVWG
ncbi:maleylpyruvate isomerase family mycothiol-dependent enzyme [Streptomyces apocyni]|uniref:maleylpyruvate isomerase family mycothiol-dependent enzyme n=1 Tax=Streptomyces apocyni TaxID=2654677 RepID=UPI0012EA07DB|nr:maleylpyruvate isomerase family mycothiol-dependent enzyme [Streptomyces apocyni]